MLFTSILFTGTQNNKLIDQSEMPLFFEDLNLDQVFRAILKKKAEYQLEPFFFASLSEISQITYRQDIFRDFENTNLLKIIKIFAQKMIVLRRYMELLTKLYYKHHITGWFLEAVLVYCEAIQTLTQDLAEIKTNSAGFQNFLIYTNNYLSSENFKTLNSDSDTLKKALKKINYCVIIKDAQVQVRRYKNEIDYSKVVEKTFEKFKQRDVKNYKAEFIKTSGMNHIEGQILDAVEKLYPEIFENLEQFYNKNQNFQDEVIMRFDREVQFYVSYLEYIENINQIGLKFCYPVINNQNKEVKNLNGFDIALAKKLSLENEKIITNDFHLSGNERIIVVSGPNQGGKTTFARTFGQLHYLASLGLPVMGSEAKLFLFDNIFTHFEKEEDIRNLRGKLQDDLFRINKIFEYSTSNSIIILNEIFTSTTLKDAIFLSKEILSRISEMDILCVCVTFMDELSTLSEKTISMVSTVVPENPSIRTFKIIKRPADGLAYTLSIVEKYQLTYNKLKERIQP